MRFIHVYLGVYFLLIVGAAVTLWHAGAFTRVPASWLLISAVATIGLGVMLAAVFKRPASVNRE